MKYSIVTFGCRVNQADSLSIEESLRARGGIESSSSQADIVVVNTCSVTCSADQGARQTVRRIARENPGARIVVTGCYATRKPDEVATLPGVVRVVRNDDKLTLATMLERMGELSTADRFGGGEGPCGAPIAPGFQGRTAFTLRVQTGCEERCSYCIIPSTRGRGRSLPISDVCREVERVAAAGFKEIALTGVHLGSYGRDLTPVASLIELFGALGRIDDRRDLPRELARADGLHAGDCRARGRSEGRFAPHFHLPLQHASDRMLRLMRRPYTLDYYRRLVDGIVEQMPHASIGSDMIVGFPGETDDDFACNLEYLPASPLSHLHVFPYSDRPGTAASCECADKVPGPDDSRREACGCGRSVPNCRSASAASQVGTDQARPHDRGRHDGRHRQLS